MCGLFSDTFSKGGGDGPRPQQHGKEVELPTKETRMIGNRSKGLYHRVPSRASTGILWLNVV